MILSVDIGTSTIKAGLFLYKNSRLSLIEQGRLKLSLLGEARDASHWLTGFTQALDTLSPDGLAQVEAIVVCGNGPSLVAVDENGQPLAKVLEWSDTRGRVEVTQLLAGCEVEASFYLAKAYWFKTSEKVLYSQTRYFLTCPDFLNLCLCGRAVTSVPNPRYTRYYWTGPSLQLLGLDSAKFPATVYSGHDIGTILPALAARTGINPQARVIAGGPDFIMSLAGTATVRPSLVCDRTGTSEGINYCADRPCTDPRLLCVPHLHDNLWNISGMLSAAGKSIQWFADIIKLPGAEINGYLKQLARRSGTVRNLIFLPHLQGERAPWHNAAARGAFVGLEASHTAQDMMLCILESLCFAVRQIIDIMQDNGLNFPHLRVTGALAELELLNQLKADITGKTIIVSVPRDAELLGCALTALAGGPSGHAQAAALAGSVSDGPTFTPDVRNYQYYEKKYQIFKDTYRQLLPVFDTLAT